MTSKDAEIRLAQIDAEIRAKRLEALKLIEEHVGLGLTFPIVDEVVLNAANRAIRAAVIRITGHDIEPLMWKED